MSSAWRKLPWKKVHGWSTPGTSYFKGRGRVLLGYFFGNEKNLFRELVLRAQEELDKSAEDLEK